MKATQASSRAGSGPAPDGPARVYSLLVGAALLLGGIGGFFYESSFDTGSSLVADDIFGVFPTNGFDNLFHVLAGIAGLAMASRAPRRFALGGGVVFTVIAIWGMLETDRGFGTILSLFPVGTEDNLLHLAVGLSGIVAGGLTLEQAAED